MATPHVAGPGGADHEPAAGDHAGAGRGDHPRHGKDIGAPGKDDEFGYGLIQPRNALFGQGIRR